MKLAMSFHKRSGRYIIQNEDGKPVQFPTEERIIRIWKKEIPSVEFSLGSYVVGPLVRFYADVGSGTTPKQRQRFCETLANESIES